MEWARILAYITGTVDQELLLRNEYRAAENRILRAQLAGRLRLSDSELGDARRDWSSIGPQGTGRGGDRGPAGYHLGMVPKARRAQVRWLDGTSNPRQAPAGQGC